MRYRITGTLLLFLVLGFPVFGQRMGVMDFRNQNIVDILMALAETSGMSIIPDETVEGKASFHFTDSDFFEALELFLGSYKLYAVREGNSIRVSRIKTSYNGDTRRVSLAAEDTDIEKVIRALARSINTSILYDPLPEIRVSLDIQELSPGEALAICMLRLDSYSLEENENYYYLRKVNSGDPLSPAARQGYISREGESYSLALQNARFLDVLEELFKTAEKEYSLLTKNDGIIEDLYFADRPFDEMLRLVLEQGNADYVERKGIYYIVELQRRDIVRKLKDTEIINLTHISAQELPALLPGELAAGNALKIDRASNAVLLTGSPEEIRPLRDFIAKIDKPAAGQRFERFDLSYITVDETLAMLPPRLTPTAPAAVPGANAFIAAGSPEGLGALREYITALDRKGEGCPIQLKYIKIDELLKALPPSVHKEDILDSGYPNLLFFTGAPEKRALFQRELALIDRPKPQIRYELLVIEYMKSNETRFTKSFSAASSGDNSNMTLLGNLSNLFNLSFDVVAQFGYQFAANLSLQLGENIAAVYADTTLNGLSGQEIKFQNTDTYRYQEFEVNADTGNITRTGVTREISSGLIVSLNGWVSGDDMITMTVNATVSKQNNHGASDGSTVPSTSERVVFTHLRTPSGTPIVLSGLMKEDSAKGRKKIPILGDIPLLGRLFRDSTDTKEKTEIVIYIVPYLSRDAGEEQDLPRRLERYYHSFVAERLP
jgi:type II secretory pathway component GspD/PulD (secretin)